MSPRPRTRAGVRAHAGEELLRDFADGDLSATHADPEAALADGGTLDAAQRRLAQVAALAAVGAPAVSWFTHFASASDPIDAEDIVGVLVAVAPIIGAPRVVAAAESAIEASRLAERSDEDGL